MDGPEFTPEVTISVAGDPIAAKAVTELTPSERDMWLRAFYADEYRAELLRLAELGVPGPEEE
jgi:hypothetical protein